MPNRPDNPQPEGTSSNLVPFQQQNPYALLDLERATVPYLTTLDTSDPEQAFYLQECLEGEADDFAAWINREFPAQHVTFHTWEEKDRETGEVFQGVYCKLLSPDGKILGFTSQRAIRAMRMIANLAQIGPPPWDPPLPIECRQVEYKNGQRGFTLRVSADTIRSRSVAKPGKKK